MGQVAGDRKRERGEEREREGGVGTRRKRCSLKGKAILLLPCTDDIVKQTHTQWHKYTNTHTHIHTHTLHTPTHTNKYYTRTHTYLHIGTLSCSILTHLLLKYQLSKGLWTLVHQTASSLQAHFALFPLPPLSLSLPLFASLSVSAWT